MADDLSPLIADLSSPEASRRAAAAERLMHLGPAARAAALPLVRAAGDAEEEVREAAIGAMEAFGAPSPDDAPALLQLLAGIALNANELEATRAYWALTLLARLGPEGPHVPPLREELLRRIAATEEDYNVRRRCLLIATLCGAGDPRLAPALRKIAAGGEPGLVLAARQALANLGEGEAT